MPALVNATNKVSLLLDTGYSMTMLHADHVAAAELKPTGRRITIVGIAGEEQAREETSHRGAQRVERDSAADAEGRV